ncbi:MAG TPA: sugar phosphate isomerase/epimerase [Candidatus Acidoferrales bacterium]
MTDNLNGNATDRRLFLKEMAIYSGGLAVAGYATNFGGFLVPTAHAQGVVGGVEAPTSTAMWRQHVGLELFTVRDQMTDPKSYEGALAKVSEIGYKEVEPAGGYAGLDPSKEADAKKFRTMLDSYGLSMPSTHSGATEGPDLDQQLNGFAIMGIKYTEISAPRGARGPAPARAMAPPPSPSANGIARGPYGNGAVREPAPQTMDQVKRRAEALNTHGKIAQKFGMKMLVHNHTQEFAPLADYPDQRPYDIILANTDPSLVAMQIDIGWASVAGQDILAMFKKNPGRYELWHVKDASGIPHMTSQMTMAQRMSAADLVPVGLGAVDYKTIFENAHLAGMKHYCVEQDNANSWGDSIAAAKTSYENLQKILA